MQKKYVTPVLIVSLCLSSCLGGCSTVTDSTKNAKNNIKNNANENAVVKEVTETYTCNEGDAHAIEADGENEKNGETGKETTYQNVLVEKTGDSLGDDADFYGSNAAVFATNGATLNITDSEIKTDGVHANGVFSYGEGTTVNISNSTIETEKATSGGVMVTGGGTLNATNLTVTTQSGSSAAIRSDRGGGQLNVTGGTYKSYGSGSPAIYSTADINVEDAILYADIAEAVVVEGKNSVTITNSDVTGKNTTHNSDKADVYRNVMIYQSMSGDSEEGKGEFTMTGGKLTSENGGMFFVTNTIADINLENVDLNYASDDLLRIEKAGWGTDGTNGGQVTFNAKNQSLEGQVTVDDISVLNMYLKEKSSFEGSISSEKNSDDSDGSSNEKSNESSSGKIYVELDSDSTWTLTADSEISGLTCDEDAIQLNGYTLKVDGKVYKEGTKSTGEAIEIVAPTGNGGGQMQPPQDGENPPDGKMEPPANGEKPSENSNMEPPKNGEEPPAKPDGEDKQPPEQSKDGEQPPEKPDQAQSEKTENAS